MIMDLAFKQFQKTKNFAYLAVILNFLLDLRVGELGIESEYLKNSTNF